MTQLTFELSRSDFADHWPSPDLSRQWTRLHVIMVVSAILGGFAGYQIMNIVGASVYVAWSVAIIIGLIFASLVWALYHRFMNWMSTTSTHHLDDYGMFGNTTLVLTDVGIEQTINDNTNVIDYESVDKIVNESDYEYVILRLSVAPKMLNIPKATVSSDQLEVFLRELRGRIQA